MMSRPAKRLYEFGPFSLDPAEHILSRDGEPVALRPKELAVLVALVENHGHVLTKDELLKGVWPDQFVEEGNLNRHISSLRRVLGESSDQPQYVETVPKVGYRFVARVQEIADRSGEIVMERHTIARVVTEEQELTNGRVSSSRQSEGLLTGGRKKTNEAPTGSWGRRLLRRADACLLNVSCATPQTPRRGLWSTQWRAPSAIGAGDEDEYRAGDAGPLDHQTQQYTSDKHSAHQRGTQIRSAGPKRRGGRAGTPCGGGD